MSFPGLDITGKICLVTGGTSGIGKAIAMGFKQAGAIVLAGSTRADKVSAMKQELGPDHECMQIDVTDTKSVQAAVDAAVKRFGRIDAMVNAAGITKHQPSMEQPIEEFERVIRVNLIGNFIMCQAVGRVMMKQHPGARGQRGCIVNIASLSSFVGLEGVCAYGCSKAAVVALTKSLANDWAQHGIRVNAIAPGVFPTALSGQLIDGTPRGQWYKKHTPMGRFGDLEELVGAAVYLISPSASFTTGETLLVDGGFLAKGV